MRGGAAAATRRPATPGPAPAPGPARPAPHPLLVAADLTAWLGRGHSSTRAAVLLGVYVAGGGLGIVVSGLAVPPILGLAGPSAGWRLGWLALALLSVAALAVAGWAARQVDAPAVARR